MEQDNKEFTSSEEGIYQEEPLERMETSAVDENIQDAEDPINDGLSVEALSMPKPKTALEKPFLRTCTTWCICLRWYCCCFCFASV